MVVRRCPNLNHGRKDPPVRACPMCGETVNPTIPEKRCTETEHARKKRNHNAYCIDCGKPL
jgi:hypothetical protein